MNVPTVFLSAATVDLEEWRNVLHEAFAEAGFHVLTQGKSLGMPPRDVRHMLVTRLAESHCVIHLAGMGYGSEAADPFPEQPDFQCSWTQFEYYHSHKEGKPVIAFVCGPDLSRPGFLEEGTGAERTRKAGLQEQHRQRVKSGCFDGTPLAKCVGRTLNRTVESVKELITAVAGSVREVHGLGDAGAKAVETLTFRSGLHTLPPRPPGFVGRGTDLAKLRVMNPSGTVLTGLRGMGGIGKTALALVLAHEWTPRFPDAQLFLDARGTQANPPSAGDLLAQVIQTFQPTARLPEDEAALKSIYHDTLNGKRVLILLDNAHDVSQAKPLIPPEGCALIVTARQSIILGTTKPHHVGRLPDEEAIVLLREFYAELTDADAAVLVELCAGLPLALRLAGAHLGLDATERDGVAEVAGYLRKLRAGRLRTLDADAVEAGEAAISETLRLSEEQLPAPEREAWRMLGVFTASFDARAAQAIAGADEDMLDHFVRRSLLEREGADRFKLHDLAADYARARFGDAALADLYLTHARHYTAVGKETSELYLEGKPVEGLALFDRERAQIEAAYGWLAGREDEAAARQVIYLVNSVVYTGQALRFHPRQRIAWLESHLRAARLVQDRRAEGPALGNLGLAHADLGDARQAIEFYEQQLVIAREIGDRRGEGAALGNLGSAHMNLGDARKAIEFYEQQLVITREIGDRRGEGNALFNSALAHDSLGNRAEAIARAAAALAIFEAIEDPNAVRMRARLEEWRRE
jgi:tetratricopeptide (TPR) repeat protein